MKKAVSPVIAVALLLVTSVVAVVGFQGWFQTFSSSILSDVEVQNFDNQIRAEGIHNNFLYLKSNTNSVLSMLKITDNNGNLKCDFSNNIESGLKADTKLLLTFDNETVNGSHIKDLSGYKNNGIIVGATFVENNCISNGCFNFDGVNDYIDTNYHKSLSMNESISITAFFRSDDFTQERVFIVGSYWQQNGIYILNSSRRLQGTLKFDSSVFNIDSNKVVDNQINFVVLTFDKSSGGKINLYYNGILILNKTMNEYLNETPTSWDIGRNGDNIGNFNGTIDEVSIYSKALNHEEVKILFNTKKALLYEQILPKGIKEINIENCNLTKGKQYNILGFTATSKIEQTVIVK